MPLCKAQFFALSINQSTKTRDVQASLGYPDRCLRIVMSQVEILFRCVSFSVDIFCLRGPNETLAKTSASIFEWLRLLQGFAWDVKGKWLSSQHKPEVSN